MLRYLILMLYLTVSSLSSLCCRLEKKGNVNSEFMKWRWDGLLLWHFHFWRDVQKISMQHLRLGSLLADKKDITCVLALSFSLLCSAIDCL